MRVDWSLWSQIATAIAAFFGMGLGLYNLISERSRQSVKLNVTPKAILKRLNNFTTGEQALVSSPDNFNSDYIDEFFAIEIINRSAFKLRIDTVGLWSSRNAKLLVLAQPVVMDGGQWPRSLEPHESVTVYLALPDLLRNPSLAKIRKAFAETSSKHRIYGTSKALKSLVNHAKSFHT